MSSKPLRRYYLSIIYNVRYICSLQKKLTLNIQGYRLPAPMDCPEAIHQLMLDCWQKERAHRPSFSSIVKTLDKLICCPETLRKIAASQACNPLAPDAPDLTQFASVDAWLGSLKMGRYSDNFAAAGVVSMDQVARLGLNQLVELGITLVGHQKKINNSIQVNHQK